MLDRIMECSDALDTFSGAGGIMNRPTGNGEALARLREVCDERKTSNHDSRIDALLHNNAEYMLYQQKCIGIFNMLKQTLNKEQLNLLKDYEEAQAGKEIAFKRII